MFNSFFFGYGKDECKYRLIYQLLRNPQWLSIDGIFVLSDGLAGKDRFIKVDYSIMLIFQSGNIRLQVLAPLLIFGFFSRINMLYKLDFLTFNFMLLIKLPQQCWINTVISKMSMEENATLFEWSTYPVMQSIWIKKKVNVLLREKSHAISELYQEN